MQNSFNLYSLYAKSKKYFTLSKTYKLKHRIFFFNIVKKREMVLDLAKFYKSVISPEFFTIPKTIVLSLENLGTERYPIIKVVLLKQSFCCERRIRKNK